MEISESEFAARARAELARIEAAVEALDLDIDVDVGAGGVLELTFADDSQMVLNAHGAAREIWIAARSGGFHYRQGADGGWVDTRSGEPLWTALGRLVGAQAGVAGLSLD